jgi:hypothetical protein
MGITKRNISSKRSPNGTQSADFRMSCDTPGCAAGLSRGNTDKTYFTSIARQHGWSVGKRCLCPEHNPRQGKVAPLEPQL